MKINEVLNEGIVDMIGAVGRGVVSGVGDAVAPDTMAHLRKRLKRVGTKDFELPPLLTPMEKEINAAFDTLKQKAARGGKIDPKDIDDALGGRTVNETRFVKGTPQYNQAYQMLVAMLNAEGIEVTKPAPEKSVSGETVSWDPNKSLLTIGDNQYQKTGKGWKDWYTKDIVSDPAEVERIQNEFEYVVGKKQRPTPAKIKPIQIKVGTEVITKNEEDGNWYDEEGAVVVRPEDVAELERRAKPAYQTRQMQGLRIPPAPGTVPQD